MYKKISGLKYGVLMGAVMAWSAVFAQATPPNIPGAADPGRLQERFQAPKTPRAVDEPLLPEGSQQMPPEQAEKIQFTLSALTLQGNSVFSEAELSDLYKPYLGKAVSLATIFHISDAITARYRNAGYLLARVVVPPQRVENGMVQIIVFEGRIGKASVEGAPAGKSKLLDAYLKKITASVPLQNEVLERYVLLMNDLPGVRAKAVLVPSFDTEGASDLVIQLSQDPWDASLGVDNRGTKFIGPVQFRAQGALNNQLGQHERVSVQSVLTLNLSELQFFDIGYAQPVDTEGTVAGISANVSFSNPGDTLKPFDVEGRNVAVTATLSHPWIRSRRKNVSFQGSFTVKN